MRTKTISQEWGGLRTPAHL